MPFVREERKPLSRILRDLCADPDAEITIGEIVDAFGRRGFGAMLFVFSVPNLLPLPPGSTTVLGLPLVLLAPQVMVGMRVPWLPRFIHRRKFKGADLERLFGRLLPTLEKIERLSSPRLTFMFGPIGDRLIGLICTVLALILILPVPLGNLLPAATIATLSLGLFQRDGVIALAGYLLTLTSGAALVAGYQLFMLLLQQFMRWIGM
jgi:hypothetical protein